MPKDQLSAKLQISNIQEIMYDQDTPMESPDSGTQVEDSKAKEEQLNQEITTIKDDKNLPIGGSIQTLVKVPSFKMKLSLLSGNGCQVQELQIFKKPLNQNIVLQKSLLQGLLQERSSVEEWKVHFNYSSNVSTKDDFQGFWYNSRMGTRSNNDQIVKKLIVKKQPLKPKNLLQKPKLKCLQGKCTAQSQEWVNGLLKVKEGNSNLLKKSKLCCHQEKSEASSSEWLKSSPSSQEENPNWVRSTDINLGFEAITIECNPFSYNGNAYGMKALTNESENSQKPEQMTRNPRIHAYDFQDMIKECENLEGDISPHGSRYQSSDEVNADELAGYLDEMLHIPREMSDMAKTMYT